jgi:RNA polymerase sigma factor (sigma-70 family)
MPLKKTERPSQKTVQPILHKTALSAHDFVQQHHNFILKMCKAVMRGREAYGLAPEDVAQRVAIKILQLDKDIDVSNNHLVGLLAKTIKNDLSDARTAATSKKRTPNARYAHFFLQRQASHDPKKILLDRERNERITTAIKVLTPAQQEVIKQYYLRGNSQLEIAVKMGVSVSSVGKTLSAGKKRLAKILGHSFLSDHRLASTAAVGKTRNSKQKN